MKIYSIHTWLVNDKYTVELGCFNSKTKPERVINNDVLEYIDFYDDFEEFVKQVLYIKAEPGYKIVSKVVR